MVRLDDVFGASRIPERHDILYEVVDYHAPESSCITFHNSSKVVLEAPRGSKYWFEMKSYLRYSSDRATFVSGAPQVDVLYVFLGGSCYECVTPIMFCIP